MSFCEIDGTCGGDVVIEDSLVQRSNIATGNEVRLRDGREEEEKLRREEEERKRKEKEERERSHREEEEKKEREREKKAREEAERKKREEQKAQQEEERLRKEQEEQEKLRREREEQKRKEKARAERDKKAREEAERQKREQEKVRDEERRRREEVERKAREAAEQKEKAAQERERMRGEREVLAARDSGSSQKKILAVVLVLGVLLAGYWAFAPGSTDAPAPKPAADFTNSIGMEFMLIPAGKFEMGSPSGETDRYDNEGPVHRVTIEKSFYMGRYEVTQKQWREVMGDNPSHFKGDDLPVEKVSWDDVQKFIKKLNEKEGTDKYRLPSEAEWEYACRAGTTTRYSFGDSESKLGDYAWYDDNSGDKTHPVGRKKPNPYGLYDMHGNVWEWTQDTWHSDYDGAPTDDSAWENRGGAYRVFRGGSWNNAARNCRSALRRGSDPGNRGNNLGFRLLEGT